MSGYALVHVPVVQLPGLQNMIRLRVFFAGAVRHIYGGLFVSRLPKAVTKFCEKSLSQQLQHCFDKFPVTPVSRPSFDCLTVCAGGVCVISRSQSCLGSCARDSTGDLNKNGSPSALTQALGHIPPSARREGKREKEVT